MTMIPIMDMVITLKGKLEKEVPGINIRAGGQAKLTAKNATLKGAKKIRNIPVHKIRTDATNKHDRKVQCKLLI